MGNSPLKRGNTHDSGITGKCSSCHFKSYINSERLPRSHSSNWRVISRLNSPHQDREADGETIHGRACNAAFTRAHRQAARARAQRPLYVLKQIIRSCYEQREGFQRLPDNVSNSSSEILGGPGICSFNLTLLAKVQPAAIRCPPEPAFLWCCSTPLRVRQAERHTATARGPEVGSEIHI